AAAALSSLLRSGPECAGAVPRRRKQSGPGGPLWGGVWGGGVRKGYRPAGFVPPPPKRGKEGAPREAPLRQVRARLGRLVPVDVLVDAAVVRALVAAEHGDLVALLVGHGR